MAEPLSALKQKLTSASWLHPRSYRGDQKKVTRDYWRILSCILLSSKIQTPEREHMNQEAFQAILMKTFNPVFFNIESTKEGILELLRGFPRLAIDKDPETVNDFLVQHQNILESNTANIYNSILAGGGGQNIITRETPEIFDLQSYDHWHTRLNQPFSAALYTHYPPQLIAQNDEDGTKIVLDLQIQAEIIQTCQTQTVVVAQSHFILLAFKRMLDFFNTHPDQSTFSEDRII